MEKMFKSVDGVIIELTQQEVLQVLDKRKIALEKIEQDKQEKLAKEEQEKARKESAIAKLKALGLTEEEVKSIL
jgi:DNA-binding transcriptional regulator YhcF (GntR family)